MISTQIYFSNAVGSVLFVPDSFAYLHFSGEPMSSPELRALYIHAANLLARHALPGILADHRAMPAAFDAADREWLLSEWLPHTVPPPPPTLRYAVLPSASASRRLHTDEMLHILEDFLIVSVFDNTNQAADWLKSTGAPAGTTGPSAAPTPPQP
ncbi:MAG: hypothetical protein M3Y12_15030 [Bacteroidota bacterium]|nr:hypothetical protein [Bacteroidota bacterium]